MSEWLRALITWRKRRERFAEEWMFHVDAAAAEWESLGFTRKEARRQAKGRLGSRHAYRRQALPVIGGDFPGLLELLPVRPLSRSALLVPILLLMFSVLALVFDPARAMAMQCLKMIVVPGPHLQSQRMIPPTPAGLVPVDLAGVAVRLLVVFGLARVAYELIPRSCWRLCLYAVTVLFAMAFAAAVCWVTVMQTLVARVWTHDGMQGVALLVFAFGFAGLLYQGTRLWWADVERRCPICLRIPGMPEQSGKAADILIAPMEVEAICFHGHGVMVKNRWLQHFAPGQPLFPQE